MKMNNSQEIVFFSDISFNPATNEITQNIYKDEKKEELLNSVKFNKSDFENIDIEKYLDNVVKRTAKEYLERENNEN